MLDFARKMLGFDKKLFKIYSQDHSVIAQNFLMIEMLDHFSAIDRSDRKIQCSKCSRCFAARSQLYKVLVWNLSSITADRTDHYNNEIQENKYIPKCNWYTAYTTKTCIKWWELQIKSKDPGNQRSGMFVPPMKAPIMAMTSWNQEFYSKSRYWFTDLGIVHCGYSTVWKFSNFSVFLILREINLVWF